VRISTFYTIIYLFGLLLLSNACVSIQQAGGVYAKAHSKKDKQQHVEQYALKMNAPARQIKKHLDWIYFAEEWQGVPYRYGGANKEGVDCSALVQQAYRKIYELKIPRDSRSQFKWCTRIPRRKLKWGDLLFFTIESKEISHVGIYLYNGWFLHASTSKGVMMSHLDEKYFTKYYYAAGRPPQSN
jgi:cell wall-associated NlpC family hydrolase